METNSDLMETLEQTETQTTAFYIIKKDERGKFQVEGRGGVKS